MKNNTSSFQTNPWKASWRFLRYEDQEIFEGTDADFDRIAKEIADAGFTHVMTFSKHFRWSYFREFPRLTAVLRRMVEACHRHGVYVVEHHSANLMWNSETEEQKKRILAENDLHYWPHLFEDMREDATYQGVNLRSMCQVSGETGKPFISFYNSYILCHNNDDYLRLYLDYLDTLYDTGIDGIMTDDIQFISGMHAVGPDHVPYFDIDSCTCPACRKKFKAATGYDLPEAGEAWKRFTADQSTKEFIAWKQFRYESTLNFHKKVVERYEKRHLHMMLPNYSATSVSWVSPWAFVFDDYPRLDWAFVEHCCGIIRYSYPEYLFESIHCNMLARQRKIPALALYYPSRADQQRLSWGLALYAGQRYLGDPRKEGLFEDQQKFHVFEEAHYDALFETRENVRLAFLDGQMIRELDCDYNTTVRYRFNSMGQACILHNLPWTMVNPQHSEEYSHYQVIVVPGSRFLTDAEITDLAQFAQAGGTLVWCDAAGSWDRSSATARPLSKVLELLGIAALPESRHAITLGKGKVVAIASGDLPGAFLRRCRADGEGNRDAFDCSEPTRWRLPNETERQQQRDIVEFLSSLLDGGSDITLKAERQDLLVSSHYRNDPKLLSIRIINSAQTLSAPELPGFGESDPILFPQLAGSIKISVRKPASLMSHRFSSALLCAEGREDRAIAFHESADATRLELEIPGSELVDVLVVTLR